MPTQRKPKQGQSPPKGEGAQSASGQEESEEKKTVKWPALGVVRYTDWLARSLLEKKRTVVETALGPNPFPDLWAIVYTVLVPDWHQKKNMFVSDSLNAYTNQTTEQSEALRKLSEDLQRHYRESDPKLVIRYQLINGDGPRIDQERIYDSRLVTEILGRWADVQILVRDWITKNDGAPFDVLQAVPDCPTRTICEYIRFVLSMRGADHDWFTQMKALETPYRKNQTRVKKVEAELRHIVLSREQPSFENHLYKKTNEYKKYQKLLDKEKLRLQNVADYLNQYSDFDPEILPSHVSGELHFLRHRMKDYYKILKAEQNIRLAFIDVVVPMPLPTLPLRANRASPPSP